MKEKIILLIVAISISFCAYGQNKYTKLSKSQIIDVLRSEFLNDTIKKNIESKLVVVDGIYLFKPGILEPKSLLEFLDEVFVESKIKTIQVIDSEQAANFHFDGNARHGLVIIRLKKGVGLSLKALDFALNEKMQLSSLEQNRKYGYYLLIDTVSIQLDSMDRNNFNLKWIDKIEVVKFQNYNNIYGTGDGNIVIYPKKRFKKKLLERYKH